MLQRLHWKLLRDYRDRLQGKALDLDDPGLALCKHCLQLALLSLVDRFGLRALLHFRHGEVDSLREPRLGEAGHLHHGALDLGEGGNHPAAVAVGRRGAQAALQLGAEAPLGAARGRRGGLLDGEQAGGGGSGLDVELRRPGQLQLVLQVGVWLLV